MTNHHEQLDPIERTLLDLDRAERQRVFEPTPLDVHSLMRSEAEPLAIMWWRSARLRVAVAASVALAAGVWTWMLLGEITERSPTSGVAMVSVEPDDGGCDGSFLHCFAGPVDVITSGCRTHDYDLDGDVDLADFRAFQLACLGPARLR